MEDIGRSGDVQVTEVAEVALFGKLISEISPWLSDGRLSPDLQQQGDDGA